MKTFQAGTKANKMILRDHFVDHLCLQNAGKYKRVGNF